MMSTDDITGTANTSVVYNFITDENAKVDLDVKQNKHVIFLQS